MRILPFLLFALAIQACDDDPTACCFDAEVRGAVEVRVLDRESNPVASAEVRGISQVPFCAVDLLRINIGGEGLTDQEGRVRFLLIAPLTPPGDYCNSLVVSPPGWEAPDTIGPLEVEFNKGAVPPDPSRFVIVFGEG